MCDSLPCATTGGQSLLRAPPLSTTNTLSMDICCDSWPHHRLIFSLAVRCWTRSSCHCTFSLDFFEALWHVECAKTLRSFTVADSSFTFGNGITSRLSSLTLSALENLIANPSDFVLDASVSELHAMACARFRRAFTCLNATFG